MIFNNKNNGSMPCKDSFEKTVITMDNKMKYFSFTGIALCSLLATQAVYAANDSLSYRLTHTKAGQHPYIQQIFKEQLVLRNQGSPALRSCLATVTDTAPAKASMTLYVNYDRGWHAMQKLANCYAKATGFQIKVEISPAGENLASNFELKMKNGSAPDIVMWAHDRIGDWAQRGYLRPMRPSALVRYSVPLQTWEAGKYNNRYYGYPVAMESSALIYNKALLSSAPTSFEAFAKLNLPQDVRPIEWDYTNTYFTHGILAANGGYAFKQTSSGWDATDVGVNNSGAVKGLQGLVDLINTHTLDAKATYGSTMAGMLSGNVAAMINGPWTWKTLADAGIKFGVAPIPTIGGSAGKPFVGVLTYLVTSKSKYPQHAQQFIENYLMSEDGIALVDAEWALGGVLNISYVLNDSRDPLILDSLQVGIAGQLMPNIPEMSRFWSTMPSAIASAAAGTLSPQIALDNAANSIKTAK